MRSAISFVAALGLGACATLPAAAPLRSDGLAHLGEASRIGTLVVTPQAVIEDSRCPVNARCVWAGRLVLATDISGAGWHERRTLTLGQPASLHGTTLTLTSAEPGKMAGAQGPAAPTLFGFEGGR